MSNLVAASVVSTLLVVLTVAVCTWAPRVALPLVVHNGLWAGCLLLLGSDLIAYDTITGLTWVVIAVGLVAFNVGYLVVLRPAEVSPVGEAGTPLVRSRLVFWLVLGLFGLGMSVYLLTIQRYFGIATLVTDPTSIRANRETPYLAMVPPWARALLFTGPVLLAVLLVPRGLGFRLATWLRLLLVGVLVASMLAQLQRSNLFVGLLWTASAWLFSVHGSASGRHLTVATPDGPRPVAIRRLVAGLVVLAVAGLGAFQLIAVALGKTGTQALSTGAVSTLLERSGLTSVVLYATSGIAAFDKLVTSSNHAWPVPTGEMLHGDYNPVTWGGATFDYAFEVVPVIRPWPGIAPFVEVPLQTNVYTWFEAFYRDFRVAGVALGMVAVGAALGWLYQRRASSLAFWLGSLLLSVVMLSTFATRFNSVIHLVSAAVVMALALLHRPRERTLS